MNKNRDKFVAFRESQARALLESAKVDASFLDELQLAAARIPGFVNRADVRFKGSSQTKKCCFIPFAALSAATRSKLENQDKPAEGDKGK